MSANVTSVAFTGLLPYREYRLSAVGVNGTGQAHGSAEVTAWTEEGGMEYETQYLESLEFLALGLTSGIKEGERECLHCDAETFSNY